MSQYNSLGLEEQIGNKRLHPLMKLTKDEP